MCILFNPPVTLIPLKESVALSEDVLEERLHSYSWQYPVAKEIAEKLFAYVPTMTSAEKEYTIHIENTAAPISSVKIWARKGGFTVNGGFAGFNPEEKTAIVIINIPAGVYDKMGTFVADVANVISHELNHAGTAMDKYESKISTVVTEMYGKIVNALGKSYSNNDQNAYYLFYSLYCTNDTEISAFISQTESQLKKLAGKEVLSIEEIKELLPETTSYRVFLLAKNTAKKWINIETETRKEYFINKLNELYGIDFSKNFDKLVRTLYNRACYALEKCCASAMNCLKYDEEKNERNRK